MRMARKPSARVEIKNHADAIKLVIATLLDPKLGCISDVSEIEAVGHRVVHGGPYFTESSLVTGEVMDKLRMCVDFAPLHTPGHLMGIEGLSGGHARHAAGAGVRHGVPHDHTRDGLALRDFV